MAAPALAEDGSLTPEKYKLPPINTADTNRCKFTSSAMGQANGARDKLYDLRQCKMSGGQAQGYDLAGAIMSEADFAKVNFQEAIFSKAYARSSDFSGADFKDAVLDRVAFDKSTFRQARFINSVLTGTSFDGADLEGADFTDALIGYQDIRKICQNPTMMGTNEKSGADTRESAGCKPL